MGRMHAIHVGEIYSHLIVTLNTELGIDSELYMCPPPQPTKQVK